MDKGEGPSQVAALKKAEKYTIELGDTVLLRIPSGDVRTVKLEKDSYDIVFVSSYN